ncbi:Unknown protein, partial [Striga hermonthica]
VRKRTTKRQRKAKARKASQCWCKPCVKKRRAQRKEAKRRGLRWVKNGWWIPAEDCVRLKGWDPWPEPTGTSGNKDDDCDRLMGEWRASAHDARGWTKQDEHGYTAIGQATGKFVHLNNQLKYSLHMLIMLNLFNIQIPPRREPVQPAVTQATVVAQFRDYHPEKFCGQEDPRIVDEWIQGLELIFEVMDCPDRYRIICAQLQLTGDARHWWNAYWSMRPCEKERCTWDRFREMIREKYYPTYYQAEMERQFLSLKQGTCSVDEYEREFTRLRAFVPDLVCTEAQRAQCFTDGLFPAVRHNIVGHGTQTYARTVAIAQEVDASIRREANHDRLQPVAPTQSSTAPLMPPADAQTQKSQKRNGKGAPMDRKTRRRLQQIPQCHTCGRLNRG